MRLLRRLPVLLVFLALTTGLQAQGITAETPLRPVTRTFAITDARVVQAPGRVLDRATVVIREGRIEAVGPNVTAPYDAEVLEGDSLTIYAGFIDALSHTAVPEPPDEDEERPEDPGDPPRERAGIQPDRDVRGLVVPTHASVEALRNLGFTAAHVVPHGRMLPGQGAVILLRAPHRGEHDEAVVLTEPLSLYAQFEDADGVYPNTTMGILAVLRGLFIEAERRRDATARFAQEGGAVRPAYDPVLEALHPTLDGERPFVFRVEDTNGAFRALRVTGELGVPLVLAGLPWSAPLLDALDARNIPVIAPLALPDTVATDTSAAAVPYPSASPGGTIFITERRTRSYADLEGETAALRAQRTAAVGRYEANAATLAQAGIPFAFSTLDAKPNDLRASLRRMIASGLSADDALAALTTTPARLLGLDRQLGTVETGRLANLVVTDGDYFAEDTKVRFVFVEGIKHEVGEDDTPEGADPDAEVEAVGTWSYSVATPDGEQEGTFTLTGSAGSLSGSITTDETRPLDLVTLAGNVLTFSFTQPGMGTIRVNGIIEGDTFTGTASVGSLGSFSMTATRRPD